MRLYRLDPLARVTQHCFRRLLLTMSRPGLMERLEFREVPEFFPRMVPETIAAVAHTLLDHQVSVAACESASSLWVKELAAMTGAHSKPLNEADYVVSRGVPSVADLQSMKKGTLMDPESSATLLVWLDQALVGKAGTLRISGPGVEDCHRVPASPELLELAANLVSSQAEYPMGLDTWAIDSEGRLLGLPRSALLELETRGSR